MSNTIKTPSSNRKYIVICNKTNFDGYYLRKFALPKSYKDYYGKKVMLENTRGIASWYFLNVLNFSACIESIVLTEEEYNKISLQG
jgi:hypothetical protein